VSVHQLTKTTVFAAVILYLAVWDTHVGKYPYGVSTLSADRRHCKMWSLFLLPPQKGRLIAGTPLLGWRTMFSACLFCFLVQSCKWNKTEFFWRALCGWMKIFVVWCSSVSLDCQMLFPPQVPVDMMLFKFHFLLTVGQAELAWAYSTWQLSAKLKGR